MNKNTCFFIMLMLFLALHLDALGQISFVENGKKSSNLVLSSNSQRYDSLTNVCSINGSYKHLIGQDIVFYGSPHIEENHEKYGFGFYSVVAWQKYLKSMNAGKVKILERLEYLPFF